MGNLGDDREAWDRGRIEAHQEEGLARLFSELRSNEFYLGRLESSGASRRSPRLVDLGGVPFTTKPELVDAQHRRPPYGPLPTYPLSRYRYAHRTSGTSGQPLWWLDTEEDWETWIRCWGLVYGGAGVSPEDRVFLAFSFGPYISHWTAYAGASRLGALSFTGGGMTSLQRLEAIGRSDSTVLVSTPTYALYLAQVASENGIDLAASSVRVTIHAGEPGASVPNVRRRIEEAWGAACYDHAGATEVGAWAFACGNREAIHLNELEFVFEVVDPATGDPVANGARGELVITTLGRMGMPVIRYRTGDLVERTSERCPCGSSMALIRGGVLGRADDMLIVRGVNLFPSALDDLIRGVDGVEEYEVEIHRRGGLDELVLKAEPSPGASFESVARTLDEAFRSRLNLRLEIREAPAGSLPRYELKARRYKRITDRRE
ncbi:MAG: phenylacetate--CoA ligase family protein [Thermoanaerobaculia bacterium]